MVVRMRGILSRIIVSATFVFSAVLPSQALADSGSTTPPSDSFAAQFDSLAAAMLNFYASSSGSSLQGLLQSNSPQVTNILGSPAAAVQIGAVSTTSDLQARMKAAGLGFNFTGMSDMSAFFAEVSAKSSTIDGKVTLFSTDYANALAQMRVPTLSMPTLDASGLPAAGSQVAPESLSFGLFMNSSLTNLVANHPDVFAQVSTSGLGTPAAIAAWKESMLKAGTTIGSDLSRLPMPCLAEMMQGMASGVAAGSSSSCGSCSIAGSYLHNQAANLLDPNANTTLPGTSGSSPGQTQPWLQNELGSANPGLSTQLDQVLAPNSMIGSCLTSSSAASSALSSALPGLFASLTPSAQTPTTPSTTPVLPGGFGQINPGALPSFPGGFGSLQPSGR